jgi:hypothetical protein
MALFIDCQASDASARLLKAFQYNTGISVVLTNVARICNVRKFWLAVFEAKLAIRKLPWESIPHGLHIPKHMSGCIRHQLRLTNKQYRQWRPPTTCHPTGKPKVLSNGASSESLADRLFSGTFTKDDWAWSLTCAGTRHISVAIDPTVKKYKCACLIGLIYPDDIRIGNHRLNLRNNKNAIIELQRAMFAKMASGSAASVDADIIVSDTLGCGSGSLSDCVERSSHVYWRPSSTLACVQEYRTYTVINGTSDEAFSHLISYSHI